MQREGESLDQTFKRVADTWAWFTDNFYTDAEKLAMAEDEVKRPFAALGLAVRRASPASASSSSRSTCRRKPGGRCGTC
ncbi:MAG: hypothetical protein IPH30_17060 [Betaproteobacteria bacterium]|nr:hypothetical protein [Betaproteobacteria bacterium]